MLSWRGEPPGDRPGRSGSDRRPRDAFLDGQAPNAAPRFSRSRARTLGTALPGVWSNDAPGRARKGSAGTAYGRTITGGRAAQASRCRIGTGWPDGVPAASYSVRGTRAGPAGQLADKATGPGPGEAGGGEERPVADDPCYPSSGEGKGWRRLLAALPGRLSGPGPRCGVLRCRGLHRQEEIHVRIENHQAVASLRHPVSAAREGCSAPACCEHLVRQQEDVPERLREDGPAVTGWTGRG